MPNQDHVQDAAADKNHSSDEGHIAASAAQWQTGHPSKETQSQTTQAQYKLIHDHVLPTLHLHEAELIGMDASGSFFAGSGGRKETLEQHIADCNTDGAVARLMGLKSNATSAEIAREVRKDLGLPAGATAQQVEHKVERLCTGDVAQALGLNRNTPDLLVGHKENLIGLATNLPTLLNSGQPYPLELDAARGGYNPAIVKSYNSQLEIAYGLSSTATAAQIREAAACNLGLSRNAGVAQIQTTAVAEMKQYQKKRQAIQEGLPTNATDAQIKQAATTKVHLQRSLDLGVPYCTSNGVMSNLERREALSRPAKRAAANAVHQGQYGDCYFVSAIASMANTPAGAQTLSNMIKPNADGSYVVTFPGDRKNPVAISPKDLTYYNTQDTTVVGNVIETAFLKYDNATKAGNNAISGNARVTTPEAALRLLTGQQALANTLDTNVYLGGIDKHELASRFTNAFQSGELVTASSDCTPAQNPSKDSYPLVRAHQYSVLGFNATTDKVTVRNPWGDQNGTKLQKVGSTVDGITNIGEGKLSMSLETFQKNFSAIDISGQSRNAGLVASFKRGWNNYARTAHEDANRIVNVAEADSVSGSLDFVQNVALMAYDRQHLLQNGGHMAKDLAIDTSRALEHIWDNTATTIRHEVSNGWDMLPLLNPFNW
jgi:hypothetical protein